MFEDLFDPNLVSKLLVTIGDVSEVTKIPQRKLRYWEDKGIIQSSSKEDGTTRKYDYLNIKKIILIKELLDEGFTLDASVKKVEERVEKLQIAFNKLKERNNN
ncbi:MerR family transcriptional regulator [Aliarcobacter thereius]|uniref:MerR family transcriptional regulator n=1 Tax=Aliarcobacter thereius TaxID=544718 RepID=A0A5R9H347_9BACT|nr:MerR family transcriptional regulator [Aliarcobacter thereius]TLS72613.1 MerR family transcriptional regulator [Aliarcobacter thereius]